MFPHTDYPSNVVAPENPPFLWVKAVFFHASREPQDEDIVAAKKSAAALTIMDPIVNTSMFDE